jgi:hypothetical protein
VRLAAVCLEMDGGRFERLLQLWGAHGMIIWQRAPFDGDVILKTRVTQVIFGVMPAFLTAEVSSRK